MANGLSLGQLYEYLLEMQDKHQKAFQADIAYDIAMFDSAADGTVFEWGVRRCGTELRICGTPDESWDYQKLNGNILARVAIKKHGKFDYECPYNEED